MSSDQATMMLQRSSRGDIKLSSKRDRNRRRGDLYLNRFKSNENARWWFLSHTYTFYAIKWLKTGCGEFYFLFCTNTREIQPTSHEGGVTIENIILSSDNIVRCMNLHLIIQQSLESQVTLLRRIKSDTENAKAVVLCRFPQVMSCFLCLQSDSKRTETERSLLVDLQALENIAKKLQSVSCLTYSWEEEAGESASATEKRI